MFKKLHMQLTMFSTLITSLILVSLTVVSLFISDSGIKKNSYAAFLNDVNSIITYLENQDTISHDWIAKTQNNHEFMIDIVNNGAPFIFFELDAPEVRSLLITQANTMAGKEYYFDSNSVSVLTQKVDFKMAGENGKHYYVSVVMIPKTNSKLNITILYSLDNLNTQLRSQRFMFIGLDIVGIAFLFLFSWFFTKRMIKPIEENQKKQVQFMASASHELRSPLTVILSSISAMRKADARQTEKFAEAIESEGNRMSRLIGDMLSLASADNNSWTIALEELDLDTMMLDIFEKYKPIGRKNKLSLQIDIPEDENLTVYGDKMRIEQVLSILLNNAVSYTPEHGHIWMELRSCDENAQIRIIDDGPGVSDENKEHIFDRFYRGDSERSHKEHFGLGLCIAQEIIRLHNGRINILDTNGGGATFVVVLPMYIVR